MCPWIRMNLSCPTEVANDRPEKQRHCTTPHDDVSEQYQISETFTSKKSLQKLMDIPMYVQKGTGKINAPVTKRQGHKKEKAY